MTTADHMEIEHHFKVESLLRSFMLYGGSVEITPEAGGKPYIYRRALFGNDAAITQDRKLIVEVKRGLIVRRPQTELTVAGDGRAALACENERLDVIPVVGQKFSIEAADFSRSRRQDSRFLFSDADVTGHVCGRLEKFGWGRFSLAAMLPGRLSMPVAVFAASWMWLRWERWNHN